MSSQRVIEIPAAGSKEKVLDAFAGALDFPKYFGHNLDALADCLGDFALASKQPVTIVWNVAPEFKGTRACALVLEILNEVATASKLDSPTTAVTVVVRDQPQRSATQKS